MVEDNEINQAVAIAMLQRQGYRVDVVDNGRAALERGDRSAATRLSQAGERTRAELAAS